MNLVAQKYGKPTLIKSLHGTHNWYCGVGITQSQYPCAHVQHKGPPGQYGKGASPEAAYTKWRRAVDPLFRTRQEQQAAARRAVRVWAANKGEA